MDEITDTQRLQITLTGGPNPRMWLAPEGWTVEKLGSQLFLATAPPEKYCRHGAKGLEYEYVGGTTDSCKICVAD